jgi:hypothetical protein
VSRFNLFAFTVVAAYTVLEWRGVDLLPTTEQTHVPGSVRNAPGGYRTYHSNHGFHGGK